MRKTARILAYGLTAGVVLPVAALFLFDLYLKKSNADMFRHLVHSERKMLVEKVDEYISANGRLPLALSELGYEQTPIRYVGRRGNEFCLMRDGDDYFIESWDNHGVRWQYSSKERKWHDKAVYEFEPPVNIDTLREINKIARLDKTTLELAPGEWIENADILPIRAIDGNDPDSLMKIPRFKRFFRYFRNGKIVMGGWATSCWATPATQTYDKEFGEWRYYDENGNCYRKFWNYKKGGMLIYEADR